MAGGSDLIIRASPVFWFREGRARLGARQLSSAKSLRNARFWRLVNTFSRERVSTRRTSCTMRRARQFFASTCQSLNEAASSSRWASEEHDEGTSEERCGERVELRVTGRFDLVRAHQFLVVAPAPHCRAHVAERVRCRRSRMTETRLTERPRRALSTAKGVACVRPKWLPVVMEQPYCNQSAMPLSDACGTARKSPSQRHAARGLVAMSDVSTCRVALANAAA